MTHKARKLPKGRGIKSYSWAEFGIHVRNAKMAGNEPLANALKEAAKAKREGEPEQAA